MDKVCQRKQLRCGYCRSRESWRPRVYHRPMDASPLTAFILAGGKSTRMGADKAFVDYEGRTFLARTLDLARSITSDVRIVGSREKFAPFAPVVEDIFRDCGPLGGIHAALRASRTELNLVLAVDTPFVPAAFLRYLIRRAQSAPDVTVIVPRNAAENALRAGRNKIGRLFDQVRTRAIGEEELEAADFSVSIFRNLNTPQEVESERRRA